MLNLEALDSRLTAKEEANFEVKSSGTNQSSGSLSKAKGEKFGAYIDSCSRPHLALSAWFNKCIGECEFPRILVTCFFQQLLDGYSSNVG